MEEVVILALTIMAPDLNVAPTLREIVVTAKTLTGSTLAAAIIAAVVSKKMAIAAPLKMRYILLSWKNIIFVQSLITVTKSILAAGNITQLVVYLADTVVIKK